MSKLEKGHASRQEAAWETARRIATDLTRIERADDVYLGDVVWLVPSIEYPVPGVEQPLDVGEWDGGFGLVSLGLYEHDCVVEETRPPRSITLVYDSDYPVLVKVEDDE